jgi:hypothetical protein
MGVDSRLITQRAKVSHWLQDGMNLEWEYCTTYKIHPGDVISLKGGKQYSGKTQTLSWSSQQSFKTEL